MQKIIFLKKLKSNPSKKRGDSQFIQKSFYAKILHEKRQKIMKSSRLYKRLKNAKIKKLKILQKNHTFAPQKRGDSQFIQKNYAKNSKKSYKKCMAV